MCVVRGHHGCENGTRIVQTGGLHAGAELFTREILPRLQCVRLGEMAEATGLTQGYCSFVRRGLKVPHRRHWDVLLRLSDITASIDDNADDA